MLKQTAAAAALSLVASGAMAATVGFDVTISGSKNLPRFELTNTSDTAQLLTFGLTIGDTAYNYDQADTFTAPADGSIGFILGHSANGGARFDEIKFSFTDFDSGEIAKWRMDIDIDNQNTIQDYRSVLFNNGTADNAVFTATFDTGDVVSIILPDDTNGVNETYAFGASATSAQQPAPVPLPAGLPLLVAGFGALTLLRRRNA